MAYGCIKSRCNEKAKMSFIFLVLKSIYSTVEYSSIPTIPVEYNSRSSRILCNFDVVVSYSIFYFDFHTINL